MCGTAYGSPSDTNHTGGTYCLGCGAKIAEGTTIPAPGDPEVTFTFGDITGDDFIDIADALKLFQYSLMPDVSPL